ncbi:MAG: ATP synthase F0 subunit B [Nitrospirae bacterium RIFCSPHIGHO2_01_FULL_66_17]|nr:MAG: ATP synthase F0 subunit B [Nitrospirae bacterium RIFCSPHIGHO2_01_FULL_66_17]
MPQFDTHFLTPLLFWSAVSFAILLFLLKRYAFPAITEILDARERTIAENLAKAERARQEAERLLAEYQAKLKTAQHEATAMIDQARKQAQQVAEDNQRRVKEDTDRMLATAREEMARERVRVSKELKDQAVELVMAASERILKRSLTDADQKRLVKEAIDQLN